MGWVVLTEHDVFGPFFSFEGARLWAAQHLDQACWKVVQVRDPSSGESQYAIVETQKFRWDHEP